MVRLRALASSPRAMRVVEAHPELAGLLAACDAQSVDALAELFAACPGADYHRLVGLFLRYPDREDTASLLRILGEGNLETVLRLEEKGLLGSEQLFVACATADSQPSETRERFLAWLRRLIDAHLLPERELSDQQVAFWQYMVAHSEELLDRFVAPEFEKTLWPRFERLVAREGLWELYVAEPNLWKVLAEDEGASWVRRYYHLPMSLLYDRGCFPKEEHPPRPAGVPGGGDDLLLSALERFRGSGELMKVVHKLSKPEYRNPALTRLLAEEDRKRAGELLARFAEWADHGDALRREVAPSDPGPLVLIPGYGLYNLVEKIGDGRDATSADWLGGAAEVVPLGKGVRAGKSSLAVTVEGGKKELTETLVKAASRSGKKEFPDLVRRQAEKQAARMGPDTMKGSLKSAAVGSFSREFAREAGKAVRGEIRLDISQPVRFAFRRSGLGRASFKRLSDLEARLFLRQDARVFITFNPRDAALEFLKREATLTSRKLDALLEREVTAARGGDEALRGDLERQLLELWPRLVAEWFLEQCVR